MKEKFFIRQNSYQDIVVERENGAVFYRARNRSLGFAIQECLAYMSSFNDVIVYLDDELNSYYQGKKINRGQNGKNS